MPKRSALLLALVLALLLPGALALAQQDAGTGAGQPAAAASPAANPDLQIIWPQPISEVHGVIDIVGTANIAGMAFYRLEAIALNPDYSIPENAAWIPLTTDLTAPVTSAVLAEVDTTKLPDGLYQFKLAAFTGSVDAPGDETDATVGPVRVNNDAAGGTGMTPTPAPPVATPTPAANQAPYVVPSGGATAINIRACAVIDNNGCPVLGYLQGGQQAQIMGISNDGAGWFLIDAPGGLSGWVSATVVTPVGNTANIPIVTPPTPIPTPPPPPPAPPAPPAPPPPAPPSAGLVVPTGIGIQGGGTPQCGQAFNVEVNVSNVGGSQAGGGTVTLQDVMVDYSVVTFTGYGNYPAMNPGDNYVVVIPATITTYVGNKHEMTASNNGQSKKLRYTLGTGSCGSPPPPQPTPTPGQTGGIHRFDPGQCTFALKTNVKYFDNPNGNRIGETSSGGYTAVAGQRVNDTRWYQIQVGSQYVWIRDRDAVKLQKSCRVF